MEKKNVLRIFLLAIAVVAAGSAFGIGLSKIGAARRLTGVRLPSAVAQSGATDNRTLKEKAKKDGRFTELARPERTKVYNDLSELSAGSSDVIIGIPKENVTGLTPDEKSISIDYKVQVEFVYKGKLRQGATITVSLPGGRILFPDGSMAEVKTPWFKKMQEGKAYALFLQHRSVGSNFVTVGEAQGIFEIPTTREDRAVKTHVGLMNDPMWKYQGMEVRNFIPELKRATGFAESKDKTTLKK
jgi:hypothetical protein